MCMDTTTGEEIEQPADIVVLTSYVFNNVRLLLQSGVGRPYDPVSGTGVIGKNYAYQVQKGSATGFFEKEEFNTFAGAGALGMTVDDFNKVPKGTPSWGKEFKANSVKYANRVLSVGGQGASMPFKHHYLDLDPTYKDEFGDPLIRITYDFEEQDRQLAKYLSERCKEIMNEMGADHIDKMEELCPYNITTYQSTHNTGGIIMGADPNSSAVNNYSQIWEAENVFVVGASEFGKTLSEFRRTATSIIDEEEEIF
ncbi:hypothetical protein CHI06_02030 [Bacillus sp. 7884-1]|nr:hypothetical protein CHI06_02030 [Bacillus sp. 7884-1]